MTLPFEVPGPDYRARQVHRWVFQRFARTFGEMTDLPLGVRQDLARQLGAARSAPEHTVVADEGETVKALFPGSYETVAMRYPDRLTVCLSSQAGCGLGCVFCATGQMGLLRNLAPFEIVAQVLWAGEVFRARPSSVVFMGMGEPLANYESVMAAVRSIHDDVGISARSITISTVGLVPQILRLASEPLPVTLALSLHAADDETRSELVPLNRRWSVRECLDAAKEFRDAHGRRVTIEYALIAGVNDSRRQADLLAGLLRGTDMHVNLIPLNPTPGYPVRGSERVEEFARWLRGAGANVTVRDTRGRDIDAACGQLAVSASGGPSAQVGNR